MRSRVGRRTMFAGVVVAAGLGSALGGSPARACSPPGPLSPIALPRSGATGVSTATSLIVLSRGEPTGLSLQAGGRSFALAAPVSMGGGADGAVGPATFWQVRLVDGMLPGNVENVLTATFQNSTVEVTRFTTAPGYDKVEGVAPVARAVHLWRVRYPVADIGSGNCVFAEYHGFITVDYDPGTVPNTPAASVVHTFRLAPETGGSAQQFSYTGEAAFTGTEPMGAYPLPAPSLWQPELDPTRRYCLGIAAFGDGDLARPGLQSETVCADVVQLSAAGAPPPPVIGGGGSGSGSGGGGGCAIAGTPPARGAAWLLVAAVVLARRRRR